MKEIFLFLDIETGWLDPDHHALLTLAYTLTDKLFNILETREYKLPIHGDITESSLKINGLDTNNRQHNNTLIEIMNEIQKNTQDSIVTLYWQNVIAADLQFIKKQDKKAYNILRNEILQRRCVDTKSLLQDLVNKWAYSGSTSLHNFLWIQSWFHTASNDTLLTIQAMKKIDDLYKAHYKSIL